MTRLTFDANGDLRVVNTSGDIARVDPVTGRIHGLLGPPVGHSRTIAMDPAGNLLIAGEDSVFRVDPDTGESIVVSTGGALTESTAGLRGLTVVPESVSLPEPSLLGLLLSATFAMVIREHVSSART